MQQKQRARNLFNTSIVSSGTCKVHAKVLLEKGLSSPRRVRVDYQVKVTLEGRGHVLWQHQANISQTPDVQLAQTEACRQL